MLYNVNIYRVWVVLLLWKFAFFLVVPGEGVTLNPLVLELNALGDVQELGI
jgi:hypothetical protein